MYRDQPSGAFAGDDFHGGHAVFIEAFILAEIRPIRENGDAADTRKRAGMLIGKGRLKLR